jgi:hypothetical protein
MATHCKHVAQAPGLASPDWLKSGDARKWFATLQASAALYGITVSHSQANEGSEVFHVSRWSFTKELPDLAAVERFLAEQGVRA